MEKPQRKTSGKYWLGRALETAWVFAPVEGWPAAAPWVKGKVRSVKGRWKGRLWKTKSQALLKCGAGRLGAEQPDGRREGEAHCSVTPAPEGVGAHTPAHTLAHTRPGARSGGHVSPARPRRAHTPHPGRGSSPPGDAPHSPPPESHWTSGWRGARGARGEGDPSRGEPQKPRHGGRARGGWRCRPREVRSALGARPGAVAGCGLARGAAGGGGRGDRAAAAGPGAGGRRALLTGSAGRPAGGRGGGRGALGGVAAGDTLGCLAGAAGGGGRAAAPHRRPLPRGEPLVTASTLGAPPTSFLTSFFRSTPLPRLVLPPEPRTHVPSALLGRCQP